MSCDEEGGASSEGSAKTEKESLEPAGPRPSEGPVGAKTDPRLTEETGPEGPAEPLTSTLKDMRPTAFGGGVTTSDAVFVVLRTEHEGASSCPKTGLERCHQWVGVLTRSGSPPVSQVVIESDTPSGARVDAVFTTRSGFAVLWREGVYIGDPDRLLLTPVNASGEVLAALDVLQDTRHRATSADAVAVEDGAVVCWSAEAREPDAKGLRPGLGVYCRRWTSGSFGPVAKVSDEAKVVSGVSLGWGADRGILSWVADGRLLAAPLDDALAAGDVSRLGATTAPGARFAVGHGGYLSIWQAPDGSVLAQRLETTGEPSSEALVIEDAGTVRPAGAIVLPQGFLLVTNPDKASRLLVVPADASGATLVKQAADDPRRFWPVGAGLLDFTEIGAGTLVWRPSDALVASP